MEAYEKIYQDLSKRRMDAQVRIEIINNTLELIEKNDYGKCVGCGTSIPVRRLEMLPHADLCVKCARN